MAGSYTILSALPGTPALGISLSGSTREPVRTTTDRVQWQTRPQYFGPGPVKFSVGPYPGVDEHEGVVTASDDGASKDWFLIPTEVEDQYLIAADPRGSRCWTSGAKSGDKVRLEPLTGKPEQRWTVKPADPE